jgi:hypothetical protein
MKPNILGIIGLDGLHKRKHSSSKWLKTKKFGVLESSIQTHEWMGKMSQSTWISM